MPIKQDIELGSEGLIHIVGFSGVRTMRVKPEDRLILAGRGLSDELDKIIAEEDFQERAGIKEFLGNQPREQAEREAREEMRKRAAAK